MNDSDSPTRVYVILRGPRVLRDKLEQVIRSAIPTFQNSDRSFVYVEDHAIEVEGLDVHEDYISCFWFSTPREFGTLSRVAGALSEALDWKIERRICIPRQDVLLPPRLDALREAERRVSGDTSWFWPVLAILGTVWAVYTALTATTLSRYAFILAACLAGASFIALVLILIAKFYHLRRWRRTIGPLYLVVFLPFLWYDTGGPTRSAVSALMSVLGVGAVAIWIFVTKPDLSGRSESDGLGIQNRSWVPGSCLACGYDLRELPSCRCPECGTLNYYLVERPDAREAALKHGAIFV